MDFVKAFIVGGLICAAGQLLLLFFNKRADFFCHAGRLFHAAQPLFQLFFFLDAPDGKHLVVLAYKGHGRL